MDAEVTDKADSKDMVVDTVIRKMSVKDMGVKTTSVEVEYMTVVTELREVNTGVKVTHPTLNVTK